jgi:hypothetical protein
MVERNAGVSRTHSRNGYMGVLDRGDKSALRRLQHSRWKRRFSTFYYAISQRLWDFPQKWNKRPHLRAWRLLTLEDVVEFFNLIPELKLKMAGEG